jgi:hypothetical protein
MSLRLDPRRLGYLKQLAAEAGTRPGDLVRQWVEERIDAERGGAPGVSTGSLAERVAELVERVAALEIAAGIGGGPAAPAEGAPPPDPELEVEADAAAKAEPIGVEAQPPADETRSEEPQQKPARARRSARRVAATPSQRVALHDEMIAVIRERGPMTAADLAAVITERGRYAPPRSGKPIDAAMVSQRVSNPTYRSRFVRSDGQIGLAEVEGT